MCNISDSADEALPPKPCSSAQCGISSVSMAHTLAPPRHRSRWRRAARALHTSTHSRNLPASCPSRGGSLPPLHFLFLLPHSTLPHSRLGRSLRLRLGRCDGHRLRLSLANKIDRLPRAEDVDRVPRKLVGRHLVHQQVQIHHCTKTGEGAGVKGALQLLINCCGCG